MNNLYEGLVLIVERKANNCRVDKCCSCGDCPYIKEYDKIEITKITGSIVEYFIYDTYNTARTERTGCYTLIKKEDFDKKFNIIERW